MDLQMKKIDCVNRGCFSKSCHNLKVKTTVIRVIYPKKGQLQSCICTPLVITVGVFMLTLGRKCVFRHFGWVTTYICKKQIVGLKNYNLVSTDVHT